jgi:hypothetical protein
VQTYSPLRWSQRPGLFQPFPSLKRSPRPSELSPKSNGSLRPLIGPPQLGVSCFDYKCLENKNGEEESQPSDKSNKKNTSDPLSSLRALELSLGTLIGSEALICVLECCTLLLYWMHYCECLDGWGGGDCGVFIAPNHQFNRWGRLLSMGAPDSPVRHRALSGAPATSPNH